MRVNRIRFTLILAMMVSAPAYSVQLVPERCEVILGKEMVLPSQGRYAGQANFTGPRDYEASRFYAHMIVGWGQEREPGSLEIAEEFLAQLGIPVDVRQYAKVETNPAASGLELDLDAGTPDLLVHAIRQLRSEWKKNGSGKFPRIFIAEKKDLELLTKYLGGKPILIDPADLRDYLIYGYFPPSLRHDLRLISFDLLEESDLQHSRKFFHGTLSSAPVPGSGPRLLRVEESIVASRELHESLAHFGEVLNLRRTKGSYSENLRLAFRQVDQQFRFLVNTVDVLERSFLSLQSASQGKKMVLNVAFWRPKATAIWLDEKGKENSLSFMCPGCHLKFWGKKEIAASELDRVVNLNLELLERVQKEIQIVAPLHRGLNERISSSSGEWFSGEISLPRMFGTYRDEMNRARRRLTLDLARITQSDGAAKAGAGAQGHSKP